ncbi:RIP metalloprotease [Caulobacter sp. UNC279MFTsu5.1]|uniref:M50 family metallopeptidase n=1 Tax=Caulobacter sp. UNC279MFTsu5.1 TaxID=1502775 RepID=UPI0008E562AB|nr:M50 family metallopeptidase [Caulobacter sp. UNC279MFTsu5.1]SFK11663.1 regulator of sigma E protease [Caulobacter sp. UNC279MFTsu5.1]
MIVFLTQAFAFVLVLSIVVTVHELGHFWAARACGVAIDCFSIGFGPKIVAWRDKTGVEWRIAAIPLGGYVRFSGDDNAASVPDGGDLAILKQEIAAREGEAAVSRYYHFKPVWQRAIIAAAGPVANFLLAIAVLAVFMATIGETRNPARVYAVSPASAAEAAGFKAGDVILKADGRKIETFQDLNGYIALRAKLPIDFTVQRGAATLHLTGAPREVEIQDAINGRMKIGRLGIEGRSTPTRYRSTVWRAIPDATVEVWDQISTIGFYLGRLVTGQISPDQISGVIGIGHTVGAVAKASTADAPNIPTMALRFFVSMMLLVATLSVSIGFMNLLPIPVLDGGHLLMYAYEAIAKRPLKAEFQAAGFRAGLALILGFMLFAAWNDLHRYDVFKFIGGLFS